MNCRAGLAQPTAEMAMLRALLHEQGSFPSRRTWERQMFAIPQTLPLQIGCLGRSLVELIHPWITSGRAVAIDSTCAGYFGYPCHKNALLMTTTPILSYLST